MKRTIGRLALVAGLAAAVAVGLSRAGDASRPPVAAEAALGGFGGSLELPRPGLLFRLCLKPQGWDGRTTRFALEDGFTKPAQGPHACFFIPDADKENERLPATATFAPRPDGGVSAAWSVVRSAAHPKARAAVVADFLLPQFADAVCETDAGAVAFASEAPFGVAFERDVRRLAVKAAKGDVCVRLAFAAPVRVRVRKARDWGLVKYALELEFRPREADGPDALAMAVYGAGPLAFREEGPVTVTEGKDWIPFTSAFDVEAGSALDFSALRGTDAPAGKFGRVVAKGARLEFEKRPGVPVRFYGVNVCGDANAPTPEEAEAFAAAMRKVGYNAVRFHHHEKSLVVPDAAKGSTALDPKRMARFDALVAACVKNGLYLTTDLFVSRGPISYRSLGIAREGNVDATTFKCLVQVHEGAYSNYLAFARNFLSHVNPHTGRRYADEPALALLSLVNEGNMSGVQWAGRRFGLCKDCSKEAAAAREAAFARRVTAFLREEMGYRGLITNMNNFFWSDDPPGEKVRTEAFGYADDHFYVDHPRWIGRKWSLPSSCPNTNPLKGEDKGTQRLASTRPWGIPFTVSEYNFAAPGRFRGVGGILTGAMGARQDWAGLFRFAWTHGRYGLTNAGGLSYFNMSGDPLGLAAERASVCLFLRGDLAPAEPAYAFVLPPAKAADTKATPGSIAPYWAADWAAWHARIGMCVADAAPAGVKAAAVYPDAPSAATLDEIRRLPTGGVRIDAEKGALTLDTPRTAGGFAEGGAVAAGSFFRAELGDVPATVWASAIDGVPLESSSRILLTHLTDVQNSGIRYADAGKRILLDWGRRPHLMRTGRAEVSLAVADGDWTVYALAPTGRRLRAVASARRGGRLVFTADVAADPAQATWLYELVR